MCMWSLPGVVDRLPLIGLPDDISSKSEAFDTVMSQTYLVNLRSAKNR